MNLQSIAQVLLDQQGDDQPKQDIKNSVKGIASGSLGIGGDAQDLFGILNQMKSGYIAPELLQDTLLPTTDDVGQWMDADTDSNSFMGGSFLSPDVLSKVGAAAKIGGGLYGMHKLNQKLGLNQASNTDEIMGSVMSGLSPVADRSQVAWHGSPHSHEKFLKEHTQFDWQSGYLRDLPAQPWTVFPEPEKVKSAIGR